MDGDDNATLIELALCAIVARGVVVRPLACGWEIKLAPEDPDGQCSTERPDEGQIRRSW